MSFNVGSINVYVNETAQQLIKKSVLGGKTMDLVSVIPGVKYKETLNILSNTINVQNATCGFSSNGAVAFTQREITVTALEIKESLCEKTLEKYFIGQWMKPGAPKDLELGPILGESYVEKIKEYNEYTIWQGGLSGGTYTKFDGFLATISGESSRVHPTALTATTTSANVIEQVNLFVESIPEAILMRNDLILFVNYTTYNMYTAALRAANLYHYNGENGQNFETYVPGTNVKVVATHGLSGVDKKLLTYGANLVIGTDLLNEEEKFDIWYSKDNDEVRVNIQWKLGTQIEFPEFCVTSF